MKWTVTVARWRMTLAVDRERDSIPVVRRPVLPRRLATQTHRNLYRRIQVALNASVEVTPSDG